MMMTAIKVTNDLNFLPLLIIRSRLAPLSPRKNNPTRGGSAPTTSTHTLPIVTWLRDKKSVNNYLFIQSFRVVPQVHAPRRQISPGKGKKKRKKWKRKIICINLISLSCLFTCLPLSSREHTHMREEAKQA